MSFKFTKKKLLNLINNLKFYANRIKNQFEFEKFSLGWKKSCLQKHCRIGLLFILNEAFMDSGFVIQI